MYKRDIYLDIDDNLNNYIKSVELDSNSRVWHFHLTVDYEPLDLTGKSVRFRAEKPDKTNVLNDCKIVDAEKGVVEVKLTRQVNAIPGHVKCLLKIIGDEGFVLKTKTFVVDVSKTLSDDAIVSSDEFGALEAALGKVQDIDNRFAQTNAQLSDVVTVDFFRKENETDNQLIKRLLNENHKRLLFQSKKYEVGIIDISSKTGVTFEGLSTPTYSSTHELIDGTVLNGVIKGSNVNSCYIKNLGIENEDGDGFEDGIKLQNGSCNNVIDNVIFNVKNHGVLIESYGNENMNNSVLNCKSFNGNHGFVSKSVKTTFKNCHSDGAKYDGIVLCSDNIPSSDSKGICKDNIIDGCIVTNTDIGINIYCRDYFSSTNDNGIELKNITISNCVIDGTKSYGILLGDGTNSEHYAVNPVNRVTINGTSMINSTVSDVYLSLCNGVTITGCNFNKFPTISNMDKAKNIRIKDNNTGFSMANIDYWTVLDVNSNIPKVDSGREFYQTKNTSNTIINDFAGNKKVGQVIYVTINDEYTTIIRNNNIRLNNYKLTGKGSFCILKLDSTGSYWEEVYASESKNQYQWWGTTNVTTINFDYGNIADVYFETNVTSLILSTPKKTGSYYLCLRATNNFDIGTITNADGKKVYLSETLNQVVANKRITLNLLYDGKAFIELSRSVTNNA